MLKSGGYIKILGMSYWPGYIQRYVDVYMEGDIILFNILSQNI